MNADPSDGSVASGNTGRPGHGARGLRRRISMWAARLVFVVLIAMLWSLASRTHLIDPLFIGTPRGTLMALYKGLFESGELVSGLVSTLQGTLLGFAIGALAALVTGLVFMAWPLVESFMEPFFDALNAVPRIALAPLFVLWFGLGLMSKVVLGASLVFFVVLAGVTAGGRSVEPDYMRLVRMLGASKLELFVRVVLPSAVPSVFAGLRLGLIYALLGVVAGEIVASSSGLGQQLVFNAGLFKTDDVFAILILLALTGGIATAVMSAIEKYLVRWR